MKKAQNGLINSRIRRTVYLFCVFLCVFMATYIGMYEKEEVHTRAEESYVILPPDEYLCIEDPAAPIGVREEYLWELSAEEGRANVLVFYTIHHYTTVYVNDTLVYSLSKDEDSNYTQGISGRWDYVPFTVCDGETVHLRVVSEPIYENVVHRQPEFYFGSPTAVFRDARTQDIGKMAISLMGLFAGLFAFFFWLTLRVFQKKKLYEIFYLGILLLLLSICRLTGMRSSSILLAYSSALLGYISNFCLLLSWITFHFFLEYRHSDYPIRRFEWSKVACFTIVTALLLLQATGLAELHNLLWIAHAGIVVDLIVVGIASYRRLRENPSTHTKVGFAFGMVVTAAIFLDLIRLYASGVSRSLYFTTIAFLAYAVFIFAQYLRKLQKDAETDRLTGLYNRHYWDTVSLHADNSDQAFGLLLIDLDGMKRVNDSFGHTAGDRVLVEFSRAMELALPKGCEAFRLGGDEFLVFIPFADPQRIAAVTESLERQVDENNRMPGRHRISYSLGAVYSHDYPGKTAAELLHIADGRMYDAKWAKPTSRSHCR